LINKDMSDYPQPPDWVTTSLKTGIVIPAHPLALTTAGRLDERRQRALTRYYHASGAGGIAVGVHTTQFAIRDPKYALLRPVLELAAATTADCDAATGRKTVRICGICGQTPQAMAEARLARDLGFHAGLLSLAAMKEADDDSLIAHCNAVAREIPVFGFYLQPAAGGRILSFSFWKRFAEIPNVVGIKIAPFNRYQTFDVVRAVAEAGRASEIALYTGNDDNILLDLVTAYSLVTPRGQVGLWIAGGLLGHWACWTLRAVELLDQCRHWRRSTEIPSTALTLATQITDSNSALFDAAHGFAGCIPGIHEVLRRQGLLESTRCLDPHETLSPGQSAQIDRVIAAYPHLNDDSFVREHLDDWLS
jgi:dihydrodipicolinate synthase/N-acetylneuraminate lyase